MNETVAYTVSSPKEQVKVVRVVFGVPGDLAAAGLIIKDAASPDKRDYVSSKGFIPGFGIITMSLGKVISNRLCQAPDTF